MNVQLIGTFAKRYGEIFHTNGPINCSLTLCACAAGIITVVSLCDSLSVTDLATAVLIHMVQTWYKRDNWKILSLRILQKYFVQVTVC